jgi:mevalonate kinase
VYTKGEDNMIIYVNVNKNTGEIIVNNDRFPDTNMAQANPNTINIDENNISFEIAFDTSHFEGNILSELMNINHGNTN